MIFLPQRRRVRGGIEKRERLIIFSTIIIQELGAANKETGFLLMLGLGRMILAKKPGFSIPVVIFVRIVIFESNGEQNRVKICLPSLKLHISSNLVFCLCPSAKSKNGSRKL